MKRLLPLIVLAALLTGCGGTETAGSTGAGAAVVPAGVAAYVSVDTELSSSQWQKVDSLLSKFPAKDMLLTKLRQSLMQDAKVSWENDVKPALGNELDVAVLDVAPGTTPSVALTRPKDKSKFDALVKKLNEQASTSTNNNTMLVAEQSNGWTLVSDSQANLDAFTQATGGKLADDKTYQDAIGTLDSDALVKAYVDGTKVGSAAKAAGAAATPALPRFQTAVAELVARDDGLQLKGDVKTSGKPLARSYTPKLLGVVPAGALAVVSFRAVRGAPAAIRQMPAVPGLGAVLQSLGRLAPIFSGENVIFVSPGFPIPEVTVVAEPTKVAAAAASVDRLIASLRPLLGNASVKQTSLDGVPARQVDFGRFSIYYGTTAGRLFISSSPRVVAQLRSDGQKLADDATFKEAKKAAGMGDTSAGFVYVNLKDAIPLLEGVAALSGSKLPADVDQNIRHLRTLLVYGDGSGGDTRFSAFLGVS